MPSGFGMSALAVSIVVRIIGNAKAIMTNSARMRCREKTDLDAIETLPLAMLEIENVRPDDQ